MPDAPGQDPAQALAEHIADHQVLGVMDNCEHVAGEVAKLGYIIDEAARGGGGRTHAGPFG